MSRGLAAILGAFLLVAPVYLGLVLRPTGPAVLAFGLLAFLALSTAAGLLWIARTGRLPLVPAPAREPETLFLFLPPGADQVQCTRLEAAVRRALPATDARVAEAGVGPEGAPIRLTTPDAHALLTQLRPVLLADPALVPAYALLGAGGPGAPELHVALATSTDAA